MSAEWPRFAGGAAPIVARRHPTSPARRGPPNDPKPPPAPPPPPKWRVWLIVIGVAITVIVLYASSGVGSQKKVSNLSYSSFVSKVDGGHVSSAVIDPNGHVTGKLKGGGQYTSQIPTVLNNSQLGSSLRAHSVKVTGTGAQTSTWRVLLSFLPLIFFVALFIWIGRKAKGMAGGGGLMGMGGSKAKVYDAERPSTRFADVAGYQSAKREITEVVEFLRRPARFANAGAVGPRGVLMVGPPGTGKTLLARAVAGEAGVPFFALNGSSFVELFVGMGAKRVRELFGDARRRAPAIVFIDEIDAIGQRRGSALGANSEREQTLNQLLAEMDGFDPSTGVVIMAATNRPETLDPALLRPGRFDREVEIPLPNQAERAAILKVHVGSKRLEPDADLDDVARGTPGFAGADLANLLNEAAIVAVRDGREVISASDLADAKDRIILGRRDATNALLEDEKHSVAVHEGGHALVAALCEHADPVAKVTILPSGRALGVTEQLPVDERHLYSESFLYDSLAIRLGGRAGELTLVGEASTGASNDLAGATQLATRMVREFGMSPALGPVGFSEGGPGYLGTDQPRSRPYAEATQRLMDEEVSRLLREAEERATSLLVDHREAFESLVGVLLEHETIEGSEVYAALDRPSPRAPVMSANGSSSHPAAASEPESSSDDGGPAQDAPGDENG